MMTFERWFIEQLPKTKTIVDELVSQNKVVVQTKADKSLVTTVDLQLSEWLTAELKQTFPGYTIVSEESTASQIEANKIIFIDPVDETSTFCDGGQDYAVLIGVVEDNVPVAGAVFYPARNELFYTTTERQVILKNCLTGESQEVLPVSGNAVPEQYITVLAKRRELLPQSNTILFDHLNFSNTYNNCRSVERVICGITLGHMYVWNGGAWDIAAWHALAACLGIQVKHSDGSAISYSAAQPLLINTLPIIFLHI